GITPGALPVQIIGRSQDHHQSVASGIQHNQQRGSLGSMNPEKYLRRCSEAQTSLQRKSLTG
ncbi:MAG: hypothetical protein OES26_25240, partial [Gammaproteobacteria bacterium]|nr:hypothetical protein [Gammaproteobacteria bacterium]